MRTKPANDNASPVDALLLEYLPGLRKLARKLAPRDHEELLAETLVTILHRRASFRPEGGFWIWASLTMRGVRRDAKLKEGRRIKTVGIEKAWRASTPPNQEHAVDLETVRSHVGGVLMRRATGCKLQDIANDNGTSRQRVSQIEQAQRAHLACKLNWG